MLIDIQIEQSLLIDKEISVERKFSIFRSFQRDTTTRAKEMKVGEDNIDINNRWRKFEIRYGSMPNSTMSEFYMEIKQSLFTHLHFSLCL